jgi:hypothetical protein
MLLSIGQDISHHQSLLKGERPFSDLLLLADVRSKFKPHGAFRVCGWCGSNNCRFVFVGMQQQKGQSASQRRLLVSRVSQWGQVGSPGG